MQECINPALLAQYTVDCACGIHSSILKHVVLLTDYKQQSAVRVRPRLATGNAPLFSEISLEFQELQRDVIDLLVQCPDALAQLKQCLASLVLPLGDGKVASLVDPSSYEAASTILEFFSLMAPHWNCLSTNLLSVLLEASSCKPAAAKLAEFEEARASSGPLVLFTPSTSGGELRLVHSLPLEQLQSLHPAVFTETRAAAERNKARITAEVGKPLLHVSCLEEVTTAICGFFQLPKAALVYAGCSENPLALCWLVSRDLLPYMRSHKGGLSGDHLLCKQHIAQIVFGEAEIYKCPSHKVRTIWFRFKSQYLTAIYINYGMFDSVGVKLRGTWIISYQTGENKPTPNFEESVMFVQNTHLLHTQVF